METIKTQTTSQINFDKYEIYLWNMWYMEFGDNTKYVLGLSWPIQADLEHEESKPNDFDHCQPAEPPPPKFDRG